MPPPGRAAALTSIIMDAIIMAADIADDKMLLDRRVTGPKCNVIHVTQLLSCENTALAFME